MPSEEERRNFARHLRSNPTPAEIALWHVLSRLRPRFTRQLRVDPFIGDFACRRARVIVEADGSQHAENVDDQVRTRIIERDGWLVIRFWNTEILSNIDGVVEAIMASIGPRLSPDEQVAFIGSRAGRDRKPRSRGKKNHP